MQQNLASFAELVLCVSSVSSESNRIRSASIGLRVCANTSLLAKFPIKIKIEENIRV